MELDDDKPLLRSSVCNGGHDLGYLLDVLTKIQGYRCNLEAFLPLSIERSCEDSGEPGAIMTTKAVGSSQADIWLYATTVGCW